MSGKYRLSTLGCKVNQYETEQVRQVLESLGLRPARSDETADLAVVNTCAVTCSATAKSRQALRRATANGKTPTIAIGCYASADPKRISQIGGVMHVLGHDRDVSAELRRIVAEKLAPLSQPRDASTVTVPLGIRIGTLGNGGVDPRPSDGPARSHRVNLPLITNTNSISPSLPIVNQAATFVSGVGEFANRTRAFLKIQDGCDASCTYCIIPKLRTTLRSKPIEAAVAEARNLVAAGHKEIVLTGIFLGAYGRPTALRRRFEPGPSPLAALVHALSQVDGLKRLRLSSLEPGDMDEALLEVIASHENCVPHFHLPLQAGSADVLRRMNRQYTVDDFVDMIDRVNAALDRPAITTDIIVGFPGETDAMFEETLEIARYSRFCKVHAFPFSPRPGTAAAKWSAQFVHNQTVTDRMAELRKLEQELALTYTRQFAGETHRVLIEASHETNSSAKPAPRRTTRGRADRYFEVHVDDNTATTGDLINVHINRVTPGRVHGVVVE